MIRSMYSAVTGLRNHQTMLDVIGNNISNVNTVGFKSSRVLFTDLFYQTIAAATEPTAGGATGGGGQTASGGSNPMQIGYGSAVSTIDMLMTRSGFQQTSRTLDLYISGEGFFVVRDNSGANYYTRVGSLRFNAVGQLVDSNNSFVLGLMGANSTIDSNTDFNSLEIIEINNFEDYTSLYIDREGRIRATDITTNSIVTLGRIAMATFPNNEGLSQEGNMYFAETPASGGPILSQAGSATVGELVSGGLEMSNVDLTKEFTDMIIAQRGFQANSRVITTSDQVLEELVNLKR
ncbi:MAG: flagellar hook-basal body complex protein [Clostridiales bacterium]|jgi:flagellar hook protein FlgE|nr:flagellar hook-basal body complex protein [Clostridiales bacterium]